MSDILDDAIEDAKAILKETSGAKTKKELSSKLTLTIDKPTKDETIFGDTFVVGGTVPKGATKVEYSLSGGTWREAEVDNGRWSALFRDCSPNDYVIRAKASGSGFIDQEVEPVRFRVKSKNIV